MSSSSDAASARPTALESEIETLVHAAQAEMTFDRSRSSNLAGPPVSLLIAWLLWPALDHGLVVVWVLAKTMVTAARVTVTRRFDRERSDPHRVLDWGRRFEWLLALDGLVFGLLGTLLMPSDNGVLAMILVATLLGIAAIGLVVLSMSFRAALSLTVPALLPPMLWQLAQGTREGLYVGAGMAVFLGLVWVEGRRAARHTRAMLRLRFRMDDLAAQRQQALDEAQRSSEVKGRFLATMSHEVRTPLHGILGLARLLRTEPVPGDAPLRLQRLQTIERTGEHLLHVLNDVLDYSKIEGQHLRLQPQPMDLHALVLEAADLCRAQASEKGLALEVLQDLPRPCLVMGDPGRLRQVLLNLLGNAVKYTERGSVTLSSRGGAGAPVRIEVVDTGPGVPEGQRERIFKPFEQIDGSFARQHGGTGLGLAISRELALAMGGELDCRAAPGGGARFVLTLPLPAAPAPPVVDTHVEVRPAADSPGAGGGAHVLLVEDNPVNAIVAEVWLQRLGMRVTTAHDGEQAVAQVQSQDFDLVLMDCQMPGIDGFEATARIRELERATRRPRQPIVALTANALPGDRERSLAAGMDAHLAKPFSEAELHAVLARHLARKG